MASNKSSINGEYKLLQVFQHPFWSIPFWSIYFWRKLSICILQPFRLPAFSILQFLQIPITPSTGASDNMDGAETKPDNRAESRAGSLISILFWGHSKRLISPTFFWSSKNSNLQLVVFWMPAKVEVIWDCKSSKKLMSTHLFFHTV